MGQISFIPILDFDGISRNMLVDVDEALHVDNDQMFTL